MRIVADENIPQVAEAFGDLGEVVLLPGRQIERNHLTNTDCLLVRTVTHVNRQLLENTPVKFVGTATIGTDHIDEDYLRKHEIAFSNAAGCNAEAASEYVISGLFALSQRKGFDPFTLKAGIIGHGNVGSRLHQKLSALGIETLINDPPLAIRNSDYDYVDLDSIIERCNFISLHVPLTQDRDHPTWHLFDTEQLLNLRKGCILVNAARGPVINNAALLKTLEKRPDIVTFLDTWEDEPNLSRELLNRVDLATPHIAGYSVEGRLRGTQMILDAACEYFEQSSSWRMSNLLPDPINLEIEPTTDDLKFWQTVFTEHHGIRVDHDVLRQTSHLTDEEFARHFDSLRKVYPNRFEYDRYRLNGAQKKAAAIARELLFKV